MKAEQKITPAITVIHTVLSWNVFIVLSNCTKVCRPINRPNTKKYIPAEKANNIAPMMVYSSCSSVIFQGIFMLANGLELKGSRTVDIKMTICLALIIISSIPNIN